MRKVLLTLTLLLAAAAARAKTSKLPLFVEAWAPW
jgi:hypothetical protein